MENINSLKEFLEVYEGTGDEFFICGEQYDPHLISSSMCSSFKPTDANNFISEFLELEKYSLCDDIDYDYDAEDSEHYVNEVPNHVFIDVQEPDLGVCRIYDFLPGGDSILECPSMNSISTWTRNIISELCTFEGCEDLELNDITFDIGILNVNYIPDDLKDPREIELAVAKAEATAGSDLVMKTKDIRDLNTSLRTNMSDLEGGVAATGFVDLAIETLEEALETGEKVGGFFGAFNAATDSVSAFFGKDKSFADQSAQTKIKKLVEVVRQKNLQAILGESGRTISDKDRAIILQVFGDLEFTENPKTTLGKLKASRQSLAQNNIKLKSLIQDDTGFMFTQGTLGQRFGGNLLSDYQRVLQLDPLASQSAAILAQFMGETYYSGNIQEVDL